MLPWLRLRGCSLAAVLLFPVRLFLVMVPLGLALVLAEMRMIRCSGLLMGRWMFWPG